MVTVKGTVPPSVTGPVRLITVTRPCASGCWSGLQVGAEAVADEVVEDVAPPMVAPPMLLVVLVPVVLVADGVVVVPPPVVVLGAAAVVVLGVVVDAGELLLPEVNDTIAQITRARTTIPPNAARILLRLPVGMLLPPRGRLREVDTASFSRERELPQPPRVSYILP